MAIALSGTFDQIVNHTMAVEMSFFALTTLSLFVIRRHDAGTPAADQRVMPGHPVTTLIFAGVNVVVVLDLFYQEPINSGLGIAIALAGLPAYALWRGRRGR